jgi:Cu+-exporting ATPase
VLFRKGDALQSLSETQLVAFDKTGTLTEGKPELTGFVPVDAADSDTLLATIAAVEARSEHPIAKAIIEAASKKQLDIPKADDVSATTGLGVEGVVGQKHVIIGSDKIFERKGIDLSGFSADAKEHAARGETVFFAAIDGQAVAMLCVTDPIKPNAKMLVDALKKRGIETALLTGDRAETAQAVADQLGITHVVAGMLPDDKAKSVAQLQAKGAVAFVGDGMNDGPALATADTGIAIGTGTDVAIEAADVVLMSGDLRGVETALYVSVATMRNIRQNLFWAFGYNVALVPVAAGILFAPFGLLLSPVLAAGAMAASSVFVVTNALRLRMLRSGTI